MDIYSDIVTLKKKNGETVDQIKCSVQDNKIYIPLPKFSIDQHDLILRRTSNGAEETYSVIDATLREHPRLGHYEVTVKKEGWDAPQTEGPNITYNVSGDNARINQQSTDNSVNTVITNQGIAEHIDELRDELQRLQLGQAELTEALEIVDGVEAQIKSGTARPSVVKALLSALPVVGSVSTIVANIIGLL